VGDWSSSENNRRVRNYRLTRAGHKQIEREAAEWRATTTIMERFLSLSKEQA
jgi:PadR family transcriptional regulator PadR